MKALEVFSSSVYRYTNYCTGVSYCTVSITCVPDRNIPIQDNLCIVYFFHGTCIVRAARF